MKGHEGKRNSQPWTFLCGGFDRQTKTSLESSIPANSLILLAPHILIRYLSLEAQRTVRSPCPPLDDVSSPRERSYCSNSLQNTNHCKQELHSTTFFSFGANVCTASWLRLFDGYARILGRKGLFGHQLQQHLRFNIRRHELLRANHEI